MHNGITGVDLFAGAGGTSEGAIDAGVNVIWAGNHMPEAVQYHQLNHPLATHVCQDLHQANWADVPSHDILFASPCCQGHSIAAGKKKRTIQADKSRSTAWAVVSCLEIHKAPLVVIENVADFLKWELYPAWEFAMKQLGYTLSPHFINAADLGVPQSRKRLFLIGTRGKAPLNLSLEKEDHVAARSFIDTSFDGHKWDLVANRVKSTRNRVANGRKEYGDLFLDAAYGSEVGGRDIDKPCGTITTVNKHSVVMGEYIRPFTIKEMSAAQTFRDDYKFPEKKTITKMMIGNAVPPLMAKKITQALLKAA